MKITATTTRVIMTTLVIALLAYDTLAITGGGEGVSISQWFASFKDYPFVVFGCGWLCCHFFGYVVPSGIPQGKRTDLLKLAAEIRQSQYTMHIDWAMQLEKIAGA